MNRRAPLFQIVASVVALGFGFMWVAAASADLYVVSMGDGVADVTASATSTAVDVLKFDNAGAPQSTLNMPIADNGANKAFTLRGNSTSQGFITASTDGQYLLMSGFMTAPGVASVNSTPSTEVPRGVARITIGTGAIDTTTVFSGDLSYSASDPRSATSTNGTDIWVGGTAGSAANGGTRYTTLGSTTSTQVSDSVTNTRVVNITSALTGTPQLATSSMSGAFRGVSTVGTGLPTVAGSTNTLLPGFDPATNAPQDAYDFWFKDANTLYLADNRASTVGGVQKWTFDSGASTWSLAYSALLGSSGARGLAGQIDGSDTVLYATSTETSNNRLVKLIDTGSGFTMSDLASAGALKVFRGVEFVAGSINPPTNNSDFDNDGDVDGADFLTWQANLGATGVPVGNKSTGDANGDGNVNAADLTIWQAHFGLPPSIGAAGAVPEPGTLALAGLCLAAASVVRRRA